MPLHVIWESRDRICLINLIAPHKFLIFLGQNNCLFYLLFLNLLWWILLNDHFFLILFNHWFLFLFFPLSLTSLNRIYLIIVTLLWMLIFILISCQWHLPFLALLPKHFGFTLLFHHFLFLTFLRFHRLLGFFFFLTILIRNPLPCFMLFLLFLTLYYLCFRATEVLLNYTWLIVTSHSR